MHTHALFGGAWPAPSVGTDMKHRMHVSMAHPFGLVLFDPAVLTQFVAQHGLQGCGNLFEAFVQHEAVGDAAIASGAIVPMYPLEEDDHEFIDLGAAHAEAGSPLPHAPTGASAVAWQFTHSGLPLRVTSGVLVASDLMNLMSWEHGAYAAYQRQSAGPGHQLPQDDMDVAAGHYALAISGGRDGEGRLIYGLRFERVAQLPALTPGQSSESLCFEIA